MTPGGTIHRRFLTTCLAVTMAVGLAACGSSGASPGGTASGSPDALVTALPSGSGASASSPAGSGSPGAGTGTIDEAAASPGPSPSSGPDAAKLFVAILTDPSFAAHCTISGRLTVGSTPYPLSGAFDVGGGDSHQVVTVAIPGAPQTSESIDAGGVAFEKRGALWFEKPAADATSSKDLASALRTMLDVRDTGTEHKDGRLLHHLESRSGAGIPLSAIGSADPVGDGVVSIGFYVEDDGTPVLMDIEATWTLVSGSTRQPASIAIEYRFVTVGHPVAITAPTQVWSTFSSKRFGYALAYPSDWEATQSPKKGEPDSILSADNVGVFVNRYPTDGHTLNAITAAYVKSIKRTSNKASVASNTAVTADGSRARRIEWTAVYKGTREWDIDVLIVRGKNVYFVEYSSLARITPADRSTFDAFLSTLDLPGTGAASASALGQTS